MRRGHGFATKHTANAVAVALRVGWTAFLSCDWLRVGTAAPTPPLDASYLPSLAAFFSRRCGDLRQHPRRSHPKRLPRCPPSCPTYCWTHSAARYPSLWRPHGNIGAQFSNNMNVVHLAFHPALRPGFSRRHACGAVMTAASCSLRPWGRAHCLRRTAIAGPVRCLSADVLSRAELYLFMGGRRNL